MIKHGHIYKIALIGDCLAGGGAERIHAQLSVFLAEKGIAVHNCIITDIVSYEYSGSLLNLGKAIPGSFSATRKIKRFFALKKFFAEGKFDAVIDFRMRDSFLREFVLANYCFPDSTFYTVHSGILEYYFPKSPFLSTAIYKGKKIIAVSKAVAGEILSRRLADNVSCIHNGIDLQAVLKLQFETEITGKYIVAAGRMNETVKQFDHLIDAYSKSVLPRNGIKLLILGDGKFRETFQMQAARLGLEEMVVFPGFENPFPYYTNAIFTVLSSRNEGFPNLLLESLACGTPVVSYDCFSGPNEIISHRSNGLLVEDQNREKLAQAMDLFISDAELYNACKSNAAGSVARFSMEIIGKQWLEVLKFDVS